MKLITRYKKLNIWNKFFVWAGVCSVLALIFTFLFALFGPTKKNQEIMKSDLTIVIKMLQEELRIKNDQIEFLQGEIVGFQTIMPSEHARELAKQIPDNAPPYALALKAIAERRYDDARNLLDKAQEQKEIELTQIYRTRGQTEYYAGNFTNSAKYYEKAIELAPDDLKITDEAIEVFMENALYEKAEPLIDRVLSIEETTSNKDSSKIARYLSRLSMLYKATNRFNESESLVKRALEIDENIYGKDHPNVARDLNNLGQLYKATNRLKEAEPLMVRALEIDEKTFGKDNPKIAGKLNNLAQLYQATNRLQEAEPLMKRVLVIDEKSLGKDHPDVARDINNLGQLYQATNRLAEAELLMKRALEISEKAYSKDHPNVARVLNNMALLYLTTSRFKEADSIAKRSLEILIVFTRRTGFTHPNLRTATQNYVFLLGEIGYNREQIEERLNEMMPEGLDKFSIDFDQ